MAEQLINMKSNFENKKAIHEVAEIISPSLKFIASTIKDEFATHFFAL